MTPAFQSVAGEMDDSMQRLIFQIVRSIVDDETGVQIDRTEEENVTIFNVQVAPQDVGKLIGKQGRTVRSLRTILSAASAKFGRRYVLNIEETGKIPSLPLP